LKTCAWASVELATGIAIASRAANAADVKIFDLVIVDSSDRTVQPNVAQDVPATAVNASSHCRCRRLSGA
jgi:hypothetical protein